MRIRFNRQETADALSAVCSVAATRTPKPILQCVLLDAHADFLLLCATDLELGIRFAVNQVEVEEKGATLVKADKFSQIVHESRDEILVAETDGSELHVRGADSHFQIVTQDPADFPPVPTLDADADFTVEFAALRRQVEWTSFAAARESTRYAINGVLWEVKEGVLTLAATDGRRLSCAKGVLGNGSTEASASAIIPVKAMSLLKGLSIEDDAPVAVKITANQMLLRVGPTTISTSLVEGRFPNYNDVIPTDCDRTVGVSTAEFLSALRRASLLTNEESKGVRLSLTENRLTLSSRAPEQGEATVSLPAEYRGEPMEIGFNPVFLLDMVKVIDTERFELQLKESNRPGMVRVGDDLTYVVMPVSLA
jgi:DNA polymerase-3 subunit beta